MEVMSIHVGNLDFLIIVLVLVMMVRGFYAGFLRQIATLFGFIAGMYLGSLLAPRLVSHIAEPTIKASYTVAAISISAIIVALLAEFAANYILVVIKKRHKKVFSVNAYLGAILGITYAVVLSWLVSSLFLAVPGLAINKELTGSALISEINQVMPPVPAEVAELSQLIQKNGFPKVFIGAEPEPAPSVTVPLPADIQPVVDTKKQSVFKIEAVGCGGVSSGSGFVVDTNEVVTNAHVVAGSQSITAISSNTRYFATTVFFDPDRDLAVLRTAHTIQEPILSLYKGTVNRGTRSVVMGYPGGGPFTANPAGVLQQITATGRNIYDKGAVSRNVYELQTDIEKGDSGGPLFSLDGQVLGVIFGKSISNPGVGYALTSSEVRTILPSVKNSTEAVSTQDCIPE